MSSLEMPPPRLLRSVGRRIHRRMATLSWPDPTLPSLRVADINLAAAFIDVLGFCLGFLEVVHLRGITDWPQLDDVRDGDQMLRELRATTGSSVDHVGSALALLIRKAGSENIEPPPSLADTKAQILQSAGEFLRSFPLAEICELARSMGQADLAHRIHTGMEQLQANYNRLHAPASSQFFIAAVAYVNGSIELDVAAKLLGLCRSDLVAALETQGFNRPSDAILLDDTHRATILERLKKDRAQRAGKLHVDSDLLARDVIATQRIEGVDARRWLPR